MSYERAYSGLVDIIFDQHVGSYQGDWWAIVTAEKDWDTHVGFISYGYGSCSGCDEWEGAGGVDEKYEILGRMLNATRWFPNPDELIAYLNGVDPDTQWYAYEEEWPEFVAKVNAIYDEEQSLYLWRSAAKRLGYAK